MKHCNKCNRDREDCEFYTDKRNKDRLKTPCIECTREYQKGNNAKRVAYYHANKEFMRAAYRKGGVYAKERDHSGDYEKRKEYFNKLGEKPERKYAQIKSGAKTRGIELTLTYEEFEPLWKQPCFYCDDESTGLDRIDSDKGYVIDNVVPCCWFCNQSKGTRTQDEFLNKISKIYKKHF